MTGRVVESLEVSERFLWDLRQTVLELIAENHAGYLAELAHRHGMGLSIEPYDGTPCDDMTYGSRADVPMGEFWWYGFNTCFSCTEASSIAHTYGKRIVQAEAFTSNPGEDWRACPATLKPLGDWAFCDGVNRFVFHRYAHQPWLDRWPGMTMGPYGIHYERTQTWWEQSRAWLQYLSRCQAAAATGAVRGRHLLSHARGFAAGLSSRARTRPATSRRNDSDTTSTAARRRPCSRA